MTPAQEHIAFKAISEKLKHSDAGFYGAESFAYLIKEYMRITEATPLELGYFLEVGKSTVLKYMNGQPPIYNSMRNAVIETLVFQMQKRIYDDNNE